jgi:hypothetical protein
MGVSCLSCLASNEHDNFQSSVWLHMVIKTPVNRLTTEPQIIYMIYCFVIALSVLLRFTASDYPFGIFKLFLLFVGLLTLSSHQSLNICSHKKRLNSKKWKLHGTIIIILCLQIRMSKEAKRILMKDPSRRTDEEIKHVCSMLTCF